MVSDSKQYERRYINRSHKVAVITCKYVTANLNSIQTGTFEIPVKTLNQGKILKALSKQQENIYIIKVIRIDIKRYVYSMSEDTFIKYAESRKVIE